MRRWVFVKIEFDGNEEIWILSFDLFIGCDCFLREGEEEFFVLFLVLMRILCLDIFEFDIVEKEIFCGNLVER